MTVSLSFSVDNLTSLSPEMAEESDNLTPSVNPQNNNKKTQNKNYSVKKRQPIKPLEGNNVILVTRKTHFKAQLEQCIDLLTKGESEIILHGLGAAIQRCCNLAIQVQLTFPGTHDIEVNTGTLDLIDDLVPNDEDLYHDKQHRYQSSIHVRIFRIAMSGANQ